MAAKWCLSGPPAAQVKRLCCRLALQGWRPGGTFRCAQATAWQYRFCGCLACAKKSDRCAQGIQLFAAAPEDKWVAAFEPHHPLTLARLRHHQAVDEGLRSGNATATFAHGDRARTAPHIAQHARVHQVVHQHHRGAAQGLDGLDGEQFGVARAGADQADMALPGARLGSPLATAFGPWLVFECHRRVPFGPHAAAAVPSG